MIDILGKTEELLDLAKKSGAEAADVVGFDSQNANATIRQGKTESIENSDSQAIGLRVFLGKRKAIISTTDLDSKALKEMAEKAVSMAKLAPEDPYTDLAKIEQMATEFADLELYDDSVISPESLIERAKETEAAALAVKGITNSEGADCSAGSYITALATSKGFSQQYRTSSHGMSVSVIAKSGEGMERDYDYSSARFVSDLRLPQDIGAEAARRTLIRCHPQKVKTGSFPLVFDRRVAKSLLGSFLGGINGASVAKATTFLKDHMEKPVFAKGVNIINDPFRKRGISSKLFDAEGVAPQRLQLVENGILKEWLLDIRSANQMGLETNGCASRQLNSNPFPSATNVYMEQGTESIESLISDITYGIFVTETFTLGVNITTGDYSQGASGLLIENGKITHAVNEFTIAGHLLEMFRNALPANDLHFDYGVNSPTLRIDGMAVAGE
jgi:PmbA protein